ncbi:MAG: DEAD/DEAH box helicase [Sedimentibacter sp.]
MTRAGTGKTYLAAFDVRNYICSSNKPIKLLFLVHRKRILQQAEESFKDVMGEGISTGDSSCDIYDVDFLFSTTSLMSKEHIYQQFEKNYFDYIIVDEAHRAGADGYLRFLNYFNPKFLLGMIATPERPDGFDVYQLFDHNIAYEVRLNKAMEEKLLCPFHYFGITELEIDGNVIDDSDFDDIFPFLVSEERVKHIISEINFYGFSGERVKGLMFCRNIKEADELSRLFNQRGYRTVSINSKNDVNIEESINRLEQDEWNNGLEYIFTVDMFNEGIDIPEINQIIMLRPTQSNIVFVQQLGRGLRKSKDKEYVVVIDFIGNYTKIFLIPIALSGDKTYNKDNIRRYVNEGNRIIPGCSTVNFDEISRKRIFDAIDAASFSEVKLIKEEYFALKNKLGQIPQISDFDKYDSIDILRIFENKNLGSYHKFLSKYDKDYNIILSEKQSEMICFISQKLASGKRIHELELLK